jgi:hypothetical protein
MYQFHVLIYMNFVLWVDASDGLDLMLEYIRVRKFRKTTAGA